MANQPKSALELASEFLANMPAHKRAAFFSKGFRAHAAEHYTENLVRAALENDDSNVIPDSK